MPFPDPQLSFAEMAELAGCDCPAGKRLAALLAAVINQPDPVQEAAERHNQADQAGFQQGVKAECRSANLALSSGDAWPRESELLIY